MDADQVLVLARRHLPGAQRVTATFEDGWRHLAYEIDGWAILKVRKPRAPEGELAREAAVLEHLNATTSLPVPKLLGFGKDPVAGAHICMTRMPGISLHQRGRPWVAETLASICRFADDLHSQPVDPLLDRGVPGLDVEERWQIGCAYLREREHVSQGEAEILNELFARGWERFRQFRPVLLHGDFWDTNCFVDEATRQFTGIIDFGDACIGPAAWEFALPNSLADWPAELLKAYVASGQVSSSFVEEVDFYRLVRTVNLLPWIEPWAREEYWPDVLKNTLFAVRRLAGREQSES